MTNSNIDPNNFTQKDLMIHLLDASLHTVTREELKENNQNLETNLKKDISILDIKIENLNTKIDKVETNLNTKIDKIETNLNTKIDKLETKIDKIDAKFDKIQYLIIATIVTVLLKDYIISLIT
ncbi:MAG: hypothetical protein U9P72_07895 [Campylobacterota bacterium]|nr:hypothetical protein [Campylobacterota bacterium]